MAIAKGEKDIFKGRLIQQELVDASRTHGWIIKGSKCFLQIQVGRQMHVQGLGLLGFLGRASVQVPPTKGQCGGFIFGRVADIAR